MAFIIYKLMVFLNFAQNIICGCSLEPLRRGGSNEERQSTLLSQNKKNVLWETEDRLFAMLKGTSLRNFQKNGVYLRPF